MGLLLTIQNNHEKENNTHHDLAAKFSPCMYVTWFKPSICCVLSFKFDDKNENVFTCNFLLGLAVFVIYYLCNFMTMFLVNAGTNLHTVLIL